MSVANNHFIIVRVCGLLLTTISIPHNISVRRPKSACAVKLPGELDFFLSEILPVPDDFDIIIAKHGAGGACNH